MLVRYMHDLSQDLQLGCPKCKFGIVHVQGYKEQIPANKDQKMLNIISPGNVFLAIKMQLEGLKMGVESATSVSREIQIQYRSNSISEKPQLTIVNQCFCLL